MQHPAKVYYLRVDRVRLPDVPPYGGRGVNGYMLDCESGVAGSIPVDHPMGV